MPLLLSMNRYDFTHGATRVLGLFFLAGFIRAVPGVLELLFRWDLRFWQLVAFLLNGVVAMAFTFGTTAVLLSLIHI